jgi:hypothetical protein
MNRTEIEELLSAYMDDELSPQNKAKVEVLVKTNPQAKSILDGYLFVRRAIQQESSSFQYNAPAGFTVQVLATIDAQETPSKAFQGTMYGTVSRWSNPRIFAHPLAVLICAVLIGLFYRDVTTDTPVTVSQNTPSLGPATISVPGELEPVVPAPLAGSGGAISQEDIPAQPEKPFKFICRADSRAENATSVSTVFPQVFAKHEIPWTKSTSGTANTYEISVSSETLLKILDDLRENFVEVTGKAEDLSTETPLKVFFQVEI